MGGGHRYFWKLPIGPPMRGLAQRRRNLDLERIDQQIVPLDDRRLSPALIRCNAAVSALMEVRELDRIVTNATGIAPLCTTLRGARPICAVLEKRARVPAKGGL
jgi:hypothetical protein